MNRAACKPDGARQKERTFTLSASAALLYGTRRSAFRGIDRHVYERVRDFLARRHKVEGRRDQTVLLRSTAAFEQLLSLQTIHCC